MWRGIVCGSGDESVGCENPCRYHEMLTTYKGEVDASALKKRDDERQRRRMEIYDDLLSECRKHIERLAEIEVDNTIYTVPRIRLGKPPIHSFNACLCYIIYKLKKGGFRVDYIFPDKLFIRWNEGSDASVNLAAAKYFAPKIPAAAASSKSAVNDIDRTICRPASTHVAAPSSSFPAVSDRNDALNSLKYLSEKLKRR